MKYLQDYIEDDQTTAFDAAGSFFAFSEKQFNEGKKEGVKYMSLGAGLICPEDKADKLLTSLEKIVKDGIAKDIEENGIEAIIRRELYNHEAFYTGEIEDTVDKLSEYPCDIAQIAKVYDAERVAIAEREENASCA